MTTQTFQVTGMTCDHCVNAVTQEIESVPGVTAVEVALAPSGVSTVTVEADRTVPDDEVAAALDEAGAYGLV